MTRRRSFARVAALLSPLLLASCFTMMVWGLQPEWERSPTTGEDEAAFVYQDDTEWSWGLFFGRVFVTPFALVLDVLTCPVQAVLYGWDEDDCPK